jgi:hypothetical protein
MAEPFDPAHRLHEILKQSSSQDPSQPARVVWAKLLRLPPDDRAGLLRALSELADLVDEIETAIKDRTDVDAILLLEKLPAVRKAIGLVQLESNWTTHAQMLTEATVRDLRFISIELQRFRPEEKLEEEVLAKLAAEVDSLTNEVAKSTIDKELRTVLLACLESFRRAIADYRIRGAAGLRDAATRTLGELVLVSVSEKADASDRPLLRRVWGLAQKTLDVTATAMKYRPLAEPLVRLALRAFGGDPPPMAESRRRTDRERPHLRRHDPRRSARRAHAGVVRVGRTNKGANATGGS